MGLLNGLAPSRARTSIAGLLYPDNATPQDPAVVDANSSVGMKMSVRDSPLAGGSQHQWRGPYWIDFERGAVTGGLIRTSR